MEPKTPYSFELTINQPLSEVDPLVRDALKQEHFGVISEINIAAKFKEKLNIDHSPHVILGACNPQLAHQAISDNPDVALALPCNVVLHEVDGATIVSALLPSVALEPFIGIHVQKSSCTAEKSLSRIFDTLSQYSS